MSKEKQKTGLATEQPYNNLAGVAAEPPVVGDAGENTLKDRDVIDPATMGSKKKTGAPSPLD
ncbi:hypothetical protein C0991_004657, partial [Blastosporella zonata]